jgi:hypothetical protein
MQACDKERRSRLRHWLRRRLSQACCTISGWKNLQGIVMPQLIEHIDAIARRKGRAVLYLEFHPYAGWRKYRIGDDAVRDGVLAWLDANGIPWQPCGPFAVPGHMYPYLGQVYLDIPYTVGLPDYERLRDYFEFADGSMRHPGVRFFAMPLEHAQENALHDAPGFWEQYWDAF